MPFRTGPVPFLQGEALDGVVRDVWDEDVGGVVDGDKRGVHRYEDRLGWHGLEELDEGGEMGKLVQPHRPPVGVNDDPR